MSITLHLKRQPTVPLEAEVLSPDALCGLSNAEIRSLIVYHGKRQLPVGEFFDVEGERSDDLVVHGSLNKVRWIGRAMSKGTVTVHGPVGMVVWPSRCTTSQPASVPQVNLWSHRATRYFNQVNFARAGDRTVAIC